MMTCFLLFNLLIPKYRIRTFTTFSPSSINVKIHFFNKPITNKTQRIIVIISLFNNIILNRLLNYYYLQQILITSSVYC